MKKEKWIIKNWKGTRLFPSRVFESYDAGWAFIAENVNDNGDNYDGFNVLRVSK